MRFGGERHPTILSAAVVRLWVWIHKTAPWLVVGWLS